MTMSLSLESYSGSLSESGNGSIASTVSGVSGVSGVSDESEESKRKKPSFLSPREPSISKPWMRPRPTHGTNLERLFDSSTAHPESESDKRHLKVYLRIKPGDSFPDKDYEVPSCKSFVTRREGNRTTYGGKNVQIKKEYDFSYIFHNKNNTQEEIFNTVIKDNLAQFFDGRNFTIMTYGASGSGKTYSLMGTEREPGIIPRFLEALFKAIRVDRLPQFKPKDSNVLEKLTAMQKEREIQVLTISTSIDVDFYGINFDYISGDTGDC